MRRISLVIAVVALVLPVFAANNAIPTVNQPLFPSSVKPGSAAFTLMVDGSAFAPGAVVNWNGVPLPTKFVNRSRLRATVPAADVAAPGTATVTVTNPAPGGGTSFPFFSP
jgi:IPT/TIG domain-containing protein